MKDQQIRDNEWWNRPQRLTQSRRGHDWRQDDSVESADSDMALASTLGLHYGISVQAYQRLRSATGVIAENGTRYVWKPVKQRDAVTKLPEIEWLVTRLNDGGVLAAGPMMTNQQHLFCRVEENRIGYLQPWLPGQHLDLREDEERLAAISTVSRMHAITAIPDGPALMNAEKPSVLSRPSLLVHRMVYKRQLVMRVWPQLLEQFPEWQTMSVPVMDGMARAIESANRDRLRLASPRSWCHRDLAPHNLLWDGQRIGMIDFDLAAIDDPLGDLLQICNHALYLGAVRDASEWFQMVHLYAVSTSVSEDERSRMKGLLQFPETLVRAITDWLHAGQPTHGTLLHHAMECEMKRQDWIRQLGQVI